MIPAPAEGGKLGTFAGVFTPSVLTILGIVLFLRLGYVVGSVGLMHALLMIAAANAISILTSISVAATATNLRVKGGGDYYLISRTLGLGFGGAVGIILFLAQSVAVGFYCIGFAEAVTGLLPGGGPPLLQAAAAIAVIGLSGLAWLGSDWATRFQYLIMGLLCLSLGAFAFGAWQAWDPAQLTQNLAAPANAPAFWVAFAIFFPAVTGFTQGISMSGDLRDPARSIPLGTFAAVLLSMAVYFVVAILFAAAMPGQALAADGMAMKRLSAAPILFNAGVIAATLSSALASFLGAPRILQAMARDDVLPILKPFAAGVGPGSNPRRAVLLTGAIALLVVSSGSLNAVAAIVSMCFLLSYGLLNYATYFEARAASPSFRPTFRFFSRHAALAGAAGCAAVMLAIDATAAISAGALTFAVYQYIRLRAVPARWADSRRSYHLQQVRDHLLAAAAEPEHPRNWRPQLLVFADDPARRACTLQVASWVGGNTATITAVRVLERQGPRALRERGAAEKELAAELDALEIPAFPLVVAGPRLDEAISTTIQAAGIGPARANTVLANWMRGASAAHPFATGRFSQNLRTAFRLGCNLLLLNAEPAAWEKLGAIPSRDRRVDIWFADNVTGELMLLLAHLMTRSPEWEDASLRLLAVTTDPAMAGGLTEQIREKLDDVRIKADVKVLPGAGEKDLVQASRDASLVFVPFGIRSDELVSTLNSTIKDLVERLPVTVFAMAANDVDLEADPDGEQPTPELAGSQVDPQSRS